LHGSDLSVAFPIFNAAIAFSELGQTGSSHSSGFFLKKKPLFTVLKKVYVYSENALEELRKYGKTREEVYGHSRQYG
jgi:hypothetical protein